MSTRRAPLHARRRPPPRRARRAVVEWVVILGVALVAAFLVRTFVLEDYVIPSTSMTPTIAVGDRMLVDKLAYDFTSVRRGDIIVFAKPPADVEDLGGIKDLIKRVIGLPGETLRSGPGGAIYVDGRPIAQPWLDAAARADPGPAICSVDNRTDCTGDVLRLPRGEYFVMGDNRYASEDSRYFGPISGHLIVGQAFARVWPVGRFHWF